VRTRRGARALVARATLADANLASFSRRLEIAELEIEDARARAVELETSTTWRMTEPLRAAMHRGKVVAARIRAGARACAVAAAGLARDDLAARRGPARVASRVARKLAAADGSVRQSR